MDETFASNTREWNRDKLTSSSFVASSSTVSLSCALTDESSADSLCSRSLALLRMMCTCSTDSRTNSSCIVDAAKVEVGALTFGHACLQAVASGLEHITSRFHALRPTLARALASFLSHGLVPTAKNPTISDYYQFVRRVRHLCAQQVIGTFSRRPASTAARNFLSRARRLTCDMLFSSALGCE